MHHKSLKKLAKNDLKIMQKQNSQCKFSPVLVFSCLQLGPEAKTSRAITDHLQSQVVHPQIVCHEIEKERKSLPAKRPRLEYLQLNK